ncbi:type II secretion system protein GspC [Thalassotalea euphylliae]|uniref:type II secretion system protein GspC n=1 Tax=Thalassotalea euphylliae TaxID=1655234 RepID=UPI00362A7157
MQLPENMAALNEKLATLPQVKIAKAISFIIVIYIAYLLAQITWQFVPSTHQPDHTIKAIATASPSQQTAKFNIEDFLQLNVFGIFDQTQKVEQLPEVQDAPETKLNLTLSGVVASSVPKTAAAIIEHSGSQETYGIGDKIKGTRASLEQVYADRVIIKQSGRLETLMLDGFDYNKKTNVINSSPKNDKNRARSPAVKKAQQAGAGRGETVDLRQNKQLTKAVQALKTDIAENPGKISDYLKISPKREQGKVVGYRLMPGKNAEFFKNSGLKSGDVAVQMNGLDLSLPAESAQALRLLREASDIALLVDRNGELTEILFSIAQ